MILVSFSDDENRLYAEKSKLFYDSVSYYESGLPRFLSYLREDKSRMNLWYNADGRIVRYSRTGISHSEFVRYSADGRMIYDSVITGWQMKVRRFDSLGLCNDYRLYHRIYGMKQFGCYLQHYLLDQTGKISRYMKRDSLGNILGDYVYPLGYLDSIRSFRYVYPQYKEEEKAGLHQAVTREMGMGIVVAGTDSVAKCGLWQTYHPNGKIQSIGLYFNGVPDGMNCAFDTSGVPSSWMYFTAGERNVFIEQQLRLDTMQWKRPGYTVTRWSFTYCGEKHKEGATIDLRSDGRIDGMGYFYKGNSIRGADYRGSDYYLGGGTQFIPAIMGSSDRMGYEYTILGDRRLIYNRSFEPLLRDEYDHNNDGTVRIRKRRTLRGDLEVTDRNRRSIYTASVPDSIRRLFVSDSCVRMNDTVLSYSGGQVVMKKVDGCSYSDLYYEIRRYDGSWDRINAAKLRQEFVLLPNNTWLEMKTTNIRPPGLFEVRINGVVNRRLFQTPSGIEGWVYQYYESGKKLSAEFYVQGKHQGNYRSWTEEGKITSRGHYDSEGKRSGVEKSYENGRLRSRHRTIHGKQYGLEYEDRCGCMNIRRTGYKKCRTLYWADRKVLRMNIICRKRKNPYPW